MANYSIRDLENLSGIKAHTIRIWEKRYKLIEPKRTSTNIRYYEDEDLKKILNISILNRNGFKISKIADLKAEEIKDKISLLTQDASDFSSQVENLSIAMVDLDENLFDKTISRAIIQLGFESTIANIIFPFLVKIGYMWQTSTINPAQEHFITNLIRQKLIVAIDSQSSSSTSQNNKFTLFLPEGEMHELGLLFCTYLLKKRGFKTIYLGQSVPFNDLLKIQQIHSSTYFITSFFTNPSLFVVKNYLNKLSNSFPDIKILIVGGYAHAIDANLPTRNIYLIKSLSDFIELIEKI